jgi:DNA-binding NarL/FixJ family response regulator
MQQRADMPPANLDGDGAIDVLICDDSAELRQMLRAVIQLRPWLRTVGEAADGNEAVAEAARLQPDVILLDLAMPNRTGLESLAELRQVAPKTRVIVFSGFSRASVAEEAIALGAVFFLTKGADPEAINDAIEQAAAQLLPSQLPAPQQHRQP